MIEFIENENIRVKIKVIGAELCGIFHKKNEIEYIWQANEPWKKYAPILFPIVGQLKNNTYHFKKETYTLPRHGFAREKLFRLAFITPNEIHFEISDDEITLPIYPFYFHLLVKYLLAEDDTLHITYEITNRSSEAIYFSIGGHPAFNVPLSESENFEDYFIQFNEKENLRCFPLHDGLLQTKSLQLDSKNIDTEENLPTIKLSKELFDKDALVFKNLKSKEISIRNKKNNHSVTMNFDGFKYFGISSAKNANFVCLEPWLGIADNVDSSLQLIEKEGIIILPAQEVFKCTYSIKVK
nr:aldose 1-epimerase family protein [Bacteroidota bacterium]